MQTQPALKPQVQVIADDALTLSHLHSNESQGITSVVVVGPDKEPDQIFDWLDEQYENIFPGKHPHNLFVYRYMDSRTILGTITSIYKKASDLISLGAGELIKHGFFTRGSV